MNFDLQDDYSAVGTFARESITDYASTNGRPSLVVFDVQGNWGQIHLYISTVLTIANLEDLHGTPIPYIADFEKWMGFYENEPRRLPVYKGQACEAGKGDGAFNDVIAQMVADAVRDSVSSLPPDILPETVFVHAAFESEGTFTDQWHPTKG